MRGVYQHHRDPEGIEVPTGTWTNSKREALNPSTLLGFCYRNLKQHAIPFYSVSNLPSLFPDWLFDLLVKHIFLLGFPSLTSAISSSIASC
jgi:hypothetical protein